MKQLQYLPLCLLFVAFSTQIQAQSLPTKIGYGSCLHQDHEQPMWNTVIDKKPDLFLLLGDNIYGDTRDMEELKAKYEKLGANPNYQKAKAAFPIIATWDDHDYGQNDAGKNYPRKEESKKIMLEFFGEPSISERWQHPGIYTSYFFEEEGKRLQIILLDNRTFRSSLKVSATAIKHGGHYRPKRNKNATMLGEAQWKWLEEQLKMPADIRLIGTSTQFLCDFNGYEAWSNMPYERQKFIDLIRSTKANGVIFLSGDTHYAELSYLELVPSYQLYDLTSSGMTQTWKALGPNDLRKGEGFLPNNFGMVSIDWENETVEITVQGIDGKPAISQTIGFGEMRF